MNGQKFELKKYEELLEQARKISIKYSVFIGLGLGLIWLAIVGNYSLAFYFGSLFLENEVNNDLYDRKYSVGDILSVFLCVMLGNIALG